MIRKHKNNFILISLFLCMLIFIFLPINLSPPLLRYASIFSISDSNSNNNLSESNSTEKRATLSYDKIIGRDGLYHYRVLFWVPKEVTKFIPYADTGIITDVSSHGPIEKWSVEETNITSSNEKLVFIFVPKTFVYLYGKGFEKVIHLKYM
ncbi:hypothetical protein [Clostridium beijerinckii]|uniref:hypothetical protein n=1 Tax=Clostridium beijerinckii TaxID=1520 RepID=UPI000983E973|nr:hypothetical protein [Clostridium beijerinckii]AQS03710.1 hypothetical protein CLBIJ_11250 [Clostridium beijerinckii]MBC2423730.1 hypothetical protein [Clostridium beijerinckii]MBC2531127.1 hypothetical protein [Clostridium beijerinckii]MBC2536545.1 hypothetical protein [Clostridium beijerinckii]MBC2551633.1 hypothetical protein [Clostridium beijerinckii]